MNDSDFIVIGGGMAGASAAYFLAAESSVTVLEMENQPGYHTTGRSAALYTEAYGNATIPALITGGRPFFMVPPDGFTDHTILTPRGALFIGRADQLDALDRTAEEAGKLIDGIHRLDGAAARDIVPALKADYVAGAVHEPDAMDIGVDALHQGFLRGVRARGGDVVTDAEVLGLAWTGDAWQVDCRDGTLRAGILVNAVGAWCDQVAALAGAAPVGLVPKRRTAIETWPLCVDVDEQFYFKPDAGRLIGSPADETSMPPCDVQPEELDVAIAVERIETATTMKIAHIARRWADLRSFVADKTPVVGFDPALPSFFWLAGQGGYGIQTAPSMGQMTAALATEQGVPAHLADLAVTMDALTPGRFSGA